MNSISWCSHSLSVHSFIIHPPQSPALILPGCHVMVYLFEISFAIIISGESQNNGTQGCFDGRWNGSEWALVLISTLSPSPQKITGYRDNWPLLIIQLDGVELFKSSHQHTELSICNGQSSEWMNGQKGKEMWSKDAFACLQQKRVLLSFTIFWYASKEEGTSNQVMLSLLLLTTKQDDVNQRVLLYHNELVFVYSCLSVPVILLMTRRVRFWCWCPWQTKHDEEESSVLCPCVKETEGRRERVRGT